MTNADQSSFQKLYRLAGIATLLALGVNIVDVALGIGESELILPGTRDSVEWFELFGSSRFEGMYMLGILNFGYLLFMIPVYLALFAVHYRQDFTFSLLALILFSLGLAIYVANNAAVPMDVLAEKYAAATTENERVLLEAAGEAVLARGEDFTPAAFPGLILSSIAAVIISIAMLRGNIFSRVTAWIGIAGFTLVSLFTVTATFLPGIYSISYYGFGAVGGLLTIVWFLLTALRFFKLAKTDNE